VFDPEAAAPGFPHRGTRPAPREIEVDSTRPGRRKSGMGPMRTYAESSTGRMFTSNMSSEQGGDVPSGDGTSGACSACSVTAAWGGRRSPSSSTGCSSRGGPLGLKPVKHVDCPHWTPTAEDLRGRSLEDRQLLERQNFRGPALAHFAPPVPRCSYTGYTNARCAQKCALHQIRSLAREWLEWRRTTTLAQPDLLAAAQEVDEVELERWLTDAGAVYANDPLGETSPTRGRRGPAKGPNSPRRQGRLPIHCGPTAGQRRTHSLVHHR